MTDAVKRQSKTSTRKVILVLGGVRSGKSRYAQRIAEQAGGVTFIATAEAREDPEMRQKIDRHQADRPSIWTTIESPIHLGPAILAAEPAHQVILIDCLTIFAANLLERYGEHTAADHAEVDSLCDAIRSAPQSIVLVTNEVGGGVVPEYVLGRRFRDLVGEINQRIATEADSVVMLIAGLPLILKGELPL